jgi:hypothetical protein
MLSTVTYLATAENRPEVLRRLFPFLACFIIKAEVIAGHRDRTAENFLIPVRVGSVRVDRQRRRKQRREIP